ncbi:MAG: nucleoside 2-deoxyribosyltransferase [Candidatus Latescibacteria bacterium]|nr:nucleoside 2-deoxyribosyltransferase [Candidatus Latescibacterota bacterium]
MTTYSVYFAGELFDHKHLIGNANLAEAIERTSDGRYACVVPHHLEQATGRAVDIRNQDLKQVMACDLGLFNFDGTDLDSGTVVEFMVAKFLDIPSVILRSDFRSSGDQDKDGDAWNLMCSFYPRVSVLGFNAMAWYQEARDGASDVAECSVRLYSRIADAVIEQLDAVRAEPPVAESDEERIRALYEWATRFPGGGMEGFCGPGFVDDLIESKRQKGLL